MGEDQEQKKSTEASDDLERGSARSPDDLSPSPDPNLVDWDGPDDPTNPRNWPFRRKAIITGTVSLITLLT